MNDSDDDGSDSDSENEGKNKHGRKNIRKVRKNSALKQLTSSMIMVSIIYYLNSTKTYYYFQVMGKNQLEEATKKAARQEKERVARIAERQKMVITFALYLSCQFRRRKVCAFVTSIDAKLQSFHVT